MIGNRGRLRGKTGSAYMFVDPVYERRNVTWIEMYGGIMHTWGWGLSQSEDESIVAEAPCRLRVGLMFRVYRGGKYRDCQTWFVYGTEKYPFGLGPDEDILVRCVHEGMFDRDRSDKMMVGDRVIGFFRDNRITIPSMIYVPYSARAVTRTGTIQLPSYTAASGSTPGGIFLDTKGSIINLSEVEDLRLEMTYDASGGRYVWERTGWRGEGRGEAVFELTRIERRENSVIEVPDNQPDVDPEFVVEDRLWIKLDSKTKRVLQIRGPVRGDPGQLEIEYRLSPVEGVSSGWKSLGKLIGAKLTPVTEPSCIFQIRRRLGDSGAFVSIWRVMDAVPVGGLVGDMEEVRLRCLSSATMDADGAYSAEDLSNYEVGESPRGYPGGAYDQPTGMSDSIGRPTGELGKRKMSWDD